MHQRFWFLIFFCFFFIFYSTNFQSQQKSTKVVFSLEIPNEEFTVFLFKLLVVA